MQSQVGPKVAWADMPIDSIIVSSSARYFKDGCPMMPAQA